LDTSSWLRGSKVALSCSSSAVSAAQASLQVGGSTAPASKNCTRRMRRTRTELSGPRNIASPSSWSSTGVTICSQALR
jgi:hypothetical protein